LNRQTVQAQLAPIRAGTGQDRWRSGEHAYRAAAVG